MCVGQDLSRRIGWRSGQGEAMRARPIIWVVGIALVATLVWLAADDRLADLNISNGPEQRSEFELDGVRYEIAFPQGMRLVKSATPTERVDVDFGPDRRALRYFTFSPVREGARETYAKSETLRNGALLTYNIDDELEGGSGGMERELNGQITIGTHTLAVTCHDQEEFPGSDPYRLCVPSLHYLKVQNR
jgi:hypothetical protein